MKTSSENIINTVLTWDNTQSSEWPNANKSNLPGPNGEIDNLFQVSCPVGGSTIQYKPKPVNRGGGGW